MGFLVSMFFFLGGICVDFNFGVLVFVVFGFVGGCWLMNLY